MTAGMKDHIACAQLCSTQHRPGEQSNRFLPNSFFRRGQIDQVSSMNNDGSKLTLTCCLGKSSTDLRIISRRSPARRVAGKNLDSIAAKLPSYLGGFSRL